MLDALLANRLPHVELLTVGGPGVSMLAASYAVELGLPVVAMPPGFGRYSVSIAIQKRDAELVGLADAGVVVMDGCEPDGLRLLQLVKARGCRCA